MAARIYLVPVVGTGVGKDARRPKYFGDGTVTAGDLSMMDYGSEPWMAVTADLSPADHTLVVGQADAFAVPVDVSARLTVGQVNNVQSRLEAMNTPAGWVTTALTWAEVVRLVLWMWVFWQRFTAIHRGRVLLGGVTLDTTVGQLPVAVRNELTQAAASLSLSTSGIVLATTIRAALKVLGDQLKTRPISLGAVNV
jgi:hypothetical protein